MKRNSDDILVKRAVTDDMHFNTDHIHRVEVKKEVTHVTIHRRGYEPKRPSPGRLLGQRSTNYGTEAISEGDSHPNEPKEVSSLLQRRDVRDGNLDKGIDGASP